MHNIKLDIEKFLYKKREAAKRLEVSTATLDRFRKQGLIKSKKIGGQIMFTADEIARFLKDQGVEMIDNKQQVPKGEITLVQKVQKVRESRSLINQIDKLDKEIANDEKKLFIKKAKLKSLLEKFDQIEMN